MLFVSANAFAQYPYKTNVEPNLSKEIKYTQISENNIPKPQGRRYANKGQYKSVTADVFKEEFLQIPLLFESGKYLPTISDSTNITIHQTDYVFYQVIGNMFFCSGQIGIDPLNDTVLTATHISLPPSLSEYTLSDGKGSGSESNSSTLSQSCVLIEDEGLMYLRYNPKLNSVSTMKTFYYTFIGQLE